ncbi:hypothetical protein HKBW3S44_01504, partial [Candidatus Hakubella thermalkaliphila]
FQSLLGIGLLSHVDIPEADVPKVRAFQSLLGIGLLSHSRNRNQYLRYLMFQSLLGIGLLSH